MGIHYTEHIGAAELVKGMKHEFYGERLRELGVSEWRKGARGDLLCLQPPERRLQPGRDQSLLPSSQPQTRQNGLKLGQGKFRWDIRKNSFPSRAAKHWTRRSLHPWRFLRGV